MKRFLRSILRFFGLIAVRRSSLQLLTVSNPKTSRGESRGYLTAVLHLAPSRLSGYQTCPMASPGCAASCLNTAGRGGMFAGERTAHLSGQEMVDAVKAGELRNAIQACRVARTQLFFTDRVAFMKKLVRELIAVTKLAELHELTPVFRLNATSDLRWELYSVVDPKSGVRFENVFRMFPHVQFYDYTVLPNRRVRQYPNYHLTYSRKETHTESHVRQVLSSGLSVAVVFARELPTTAFGVAVINGDQTDLRFLDPRGVVVGLTAKGKAKKDTSGFVIREAA